MTKTITVEIQSTFLGNVQYVHVCMGVLDNIQPKILLNQSIHMIKQAYKHNVQIHCMKMMIIYLHLCAIQSCQFTTRCQDRMIVIDGLIDLFVDKVYKTKVTENNNITCKYSKIISKICLYQLYSIGHLTSTLTYIQPYSTCVNVNHDQFTYSNEGVLSTPLYRVGHKYQPIRHGQ